MLIQAGADLNAITRNNETPLDICEDPELKERIEKLKTDIEERRLQQQNSGSNSTQGRLKRSHSQNTRSQSVRRTSIREKSQISRREAREEARLRRNSDEELLQPQPASSESIALPVDNECHLQANQSEESFNRRAATAPDSLADTETSTMTTGSTTITTTTSLSSDPISNHCAEPESVPTSLTAPEQIILYPSYETSNSSFVINERPIDCNGIETNNSSTFDDLKLSRMVRNELNMGMYSNGNYLSIGTLADLKKQRADLRNRFAFDQTDQPDISYINIAGSIGSSYIVNNSSNLNNNRFSVNGKAYFSGNSVAGGGNNSGQTFHANNNNGAFLHSPSPSNTLKKFCGDPSDVVGEINKKGCCSLM